MKRASFMLYCGSHLEVNIKFDIYFAYNRNDKFRILAFGVSNFIDPVIFHFLT